MHGKRTVSLYLEVDSMNQKFSIKTNLELLEVRLAELKTLLVNDQVPDQNQYIFDRALVSMLDVCLLIKVYCDRPEIPFEPDLLNYLTLAGKNFAHAQQQITLGLQDDPVLPSDDE